MNCPYSCRTRGSTLLVQVYYCDADGPEGPEYVPSLAELRAFCLAEPRYTECPRFRRAAEWISEAVDRYAVRETQKSGTDVRSA